MNNVWISGSEMVVYDDENNRDMIGEGILKNDYDYYSRNNVMRKLVEGMIDVRKKKEGSIKIRKIEKKDD